MDQLDNDKDKINILISLHKGYGLGDAVAMSSVLRHVRKYRPEWRVYYRAERGKECVGNGIVFCTDTYNDQVYDFNYDAEVQITLYEKWYGFTDRPNTRVTSCLQQHFDIPWDSTLGSYMLNLSYTAQENAETLINTLKQDYLHTMPVVAIHHKGDTLERNKNLTDEQILEICKQVQELGYVPILLDWRDKSTLRFTRNIPSVGRFANNGEWGGNAEFNAAIISQCAAFVGIDSGPAKCASSTQTPSLVVWTKHHPAMYHDPCDTTTHLVPTNYHDFNPVCNDQGVIGWFETNYNIIQYRADPVDCINRWLQGILE